MISETMTGHRAFAGALAWCLCRHALRRTERVFKSVWGAGRCPQNKEDAPRNRQTYSNVLLQDRIDRATDSASGPELSVAQLLFPQERSHRHYQSRRRAVTNVSDVWVIFAAHDRVADTTDVLCDRCAIPMRPQGQQRRPIGATASMLSAMIIFMLQVAADLLHMLARTHLLWGGVQLDRETAAMQALYRFIFHL